MAKQSNHTDHFVAIRESLRAREILGGLEKHGVGNGQLYYQWLGTIGPGPFHRDLNALLDRLEKESFIATGQTDVCRVIKAFVAGIEVAQSRVGVDWMARVEVR